VKNQEHVPATCCYVSWTQQVSAHYIGHSYLKRLCERPKSGPSSHHFPSAARLETDLRPITTSAVRSCRRGGSQHCNLTVSSHTAALCYKVLAFRRTARIALVRCRACMMACPFLCECIGLLRKTLFACKGPGFPHPAEHGFRLHRK